MNIKILYSKTVILILFSHFNLLGQNLNENLSTESISVFTNQTAFYIKKGKVNTKDGIYRINKGIPGSLFGTLWFNAEKGNIKSVTSYEDTVSTETVNKATSFHDLISSNLNKKVKIFLSKDESYEGTVEEINGQLVSLATDNSWVNFNVNNINRLEYLTKPENNIRKSNTKSFRVLDIDFSSNKSTQDLSMMYLQGGIGWDPHYLVELNSDTKARLTLNAEIFNDAEDINNTEVNFVVGVPNFKYANKVATLVDFMNVIKPQVNMSYKTVMSYDTYEEEVVAVPIKNDKSDLGSIEEDLFFYTIKDLTLKKGGRGQYQLLSSDIDIQHLYECNLKGNSNDNKNYTKSYLFSPSNDTKVIHTIQLDNNGKVPWTNGSALVVKNTAKGAKPISQDMLNYTSANDNTFLKLTEAPDIQVTHKEKQIYREEKIKKAKYSGKQYYYDLITVGATIVIKSYKNKKVNINVRRPLLGELIDTSIPWLKSERVREYNPLNKTTDVCWETTIESGQEKTITYQYKIFVKGW